MPSVSCRLVIIYLMLVGSLILHLSFARLSIDVDIVWGRAFDRQPTEARREVVFLEPNLENREALISGLDADVEVVHLIPNRDGLEQIAAILAKRQRIDALHLIAHGAPGQLQLAAARLTLDTMSKAYADELAVIGQALTPDADILIYGCHFGSQGVGRKAVERLATLTGADIAASDDRTGAAVLGGDWHLEVQTGQIETAIVINAQSRRRYRGVLDITTGLVGHYPLDEGSGSMAMDVSANANDGTLQGSPSPVHTAGIIDGGLTFSGNFDRVEVTDPVDGSQDFGTNNFSVAFWFNSNAVTTTARLVGKLLSGGNPGFIFFTDPVGDVNFLVDDGSADIFIWVSGLLDGNWHHIVGVRNGNDFAIYADGLMVHSQTRNLSSISNSQDLKFGASDSSSGDYDGSLDDIRLYNRALTASDIDELFATSQPLTVDTTSDAMNGNTSSVAALLANKGGDGVISLREAITAANNTTGTDAISFNIAGAAPHTIRPTSALPTITDPVMLDATSEPSFASSPVIELDGSLAGAANGLSLAAGSDGSTIRGFVINRFGGDGIDFNNTDNNTIAGNYIGTDVTGTVDLGNGDRGIHVRNGSSHNIFGGTAAADRNVIAGNAVHGIDLVHVGTDNNQVQGNYLGVDATGTVALGNDFDGIKIQLGASGNTVGGTTAGAANVIGDNRNGVFLQHVGTSNNVIQGNYIGTDATGNAELGNSSYGVFLTGGASGNTVGGTAANTGNTITFSTLAGIANLNSNTTGNVFYRNRIYKNNLLGIDLEGNGVTANDAGDGDTGAGNLQNYPVLDTAHTTGTLTAIRGSLNSTANSAFRLEFFATSSADASGHGEGERYLGFRDVDTSGVGDAAFTFMLSGAVAAGEFVTATATHLSANDTSEFAFNVTAQAGLDSDSDGVLDIAEDRNLDADNNPATGPPLDTDGDLTPDYLDTDDDGDGMDTMDEDANGNGDPTDDDRDDDGIPDYLDFDDEGPGPGDSDGDLVADDVECPSGPPCTDSDGDGIPNYMETDHNTMVQQLAWQAGADPAGVVIAWDTGFEVDNIGFELFREEGDERVPITPSLIAGSAFLAGFGVGLPAGSSYAWRDDAGDESERYWIQAIDLQGQRTWYGPIVPAPMGLNANPMSFPSTLLSNLHQRRRAQVRPTPARPRIAPPSRRARRVYTPRVRPAWENAGLTPAARQLALVASPAVVITIDQPGWYRISQADLVRAGVDRDIDPRGLRLFAQGIEQAMHIPGQANGRLDPADVIEFYAEGLDSAWTNQQRYWLVAGTRPGLRVRQVQGDVQGPVGPLAFPHTVTHRERSIYLAVVRNGLSPNFFGAVVHDEPVEQVLLLHHVAPNPLAQARLDIALQGVSTTSHEIRVALNGHAVGTIRIEGQAHYTATLTLPQHWLEEGANTVTLEPISPETAVSAVDRLDLTYWRAYRAQTDPFYSSVPARQSVSLKGFTEATIRVFDLTDPAAISELSGTITQEGEHYSIQVTPGVVGERTLLALTETQVLSPLSLEARPPLSWQRFGAGAELVILTHERFMERLAPLRAHREAQGWSVALIDVQDLYNSWSFGAKDPLAIRDFLRYAIEHWEQVPRFVLLGGDASYDPRDYFHAGPSDWVPTLWVETATMETASDDAIADLDGDGHADLAIGRLPIRSATEAAAAVDKLIAYDRAEGDWRRRSVVVSAESNGFDFGQATEPLVAQLSKTTAVRRLKLDQLPFTQARSQLQAQLASGQLIVSYLGHGSVRGWHAEGLLTVQDPAQWHNGPRFPLVLSMTCLSGFFHDVYTESLAEALIRPSEAGAIAVWASSGLSHPPRQVEMQQALLETLLRPERPTLGEAIQMAKTAIKDTDVRLTWLLFGDPTLRLP